MTSTETLSEATAHRPKRADARRNYDALIAAARQAFTERGRDASLEDIAQRAGVGIGTLYRHFRRRQDLLEAVYIEEVEGLCQTAADLAGAPPWEALVGWLHRLVDYIATKQALADELFSYIDRDAEVIQHCRAAFYAAGEPLLVRAQEAGVVRPDTNITEVVHLVIGIVMIPSTGAEHFERVLDMALDGLHYQPRP